MNTHTETDPDCHLETFEPAADFTMLAAALRLPPRIWDIALALKGPATAAELSARTGMPSGAVLAALHRLEAAKLVSKLLIHCPRLEAPHAAENPAGEAQATTTPGPVPAETQTPPTTSPEATQHEVVSEPQKAAAPATQSQPPKPAPGPQRGSIRVSLRNTHAAAEKASKPARADAMVQTKPTACKAEPTVETAKAAASVRISLRGAAKTEQAKSRPTGAGPTAGFLTPGNAGVETKAGGAETAPRTAEVIALPGTAGGGSWLVQPVLDLLRAKAGGDPLVGQLLAYRVFLRVPANLLQAAGIRSVCLIEPDLRISDPRLKAAIEQALREVAGLSWPETKPAAA